jgi:hypothetical protein
MDVFRVSDGAFEQLDVSLHDFPSLVDPQNLVVFILD